MRTSERDYRDRARSLDAHYNLGSKPSPAYFERRPASAPAEEQCAYRLCREMVPITRHKARNQPVYCCEGHRSAERKLKAKENADR